MKHTVTISAAEWAKRRDAGTRAFVELLADEMRAAVKNWDWDLSQMRRAAEAAWTRKKQLAMFERFLSWQRVASFR